jgi:hypothetical protein
VKCDLVAIRAHESKGSWMRVKVIFTAFVDSVCSVEYPGTPNVHEYDMEVC